MKSSTPTIAALLCLALTACTPQPSRSGNPSSSPTEGSRAASPDRYAPYPGEPRNPRRDRHRAQGESGTSGTFDFYLLNLSWSPEFCATHPEKPECAQHLGFVLHGLWPQNNDGSYPERCSDAPGPADPSAFRDLYPDADLLRHEWQTHGTCSGLAPDAFFQLARQAVHSVSIPAQLARLDHQASMPPAAILDLFSTANPRLPSTSLALSCGNNYLTAVEICLARDLKPVACQQVRSCRANSVRIPPPLH